MQRGIIGVPVSAGSRLTIVDPYHERKHERGNELEVAIAPTEQRGLGGDLQFVRGDAYQEEVAENTRHYYHEDSQSIRSRTSFDVEEQYCKFVAMPAAEAHDGFAMVSSSDGEFAFGLLGQADLTIMDRGEIALGDFYLDHENEFTIATGGQSGRAGQEVDTLMAWGHEIESDDDVGPAVHDAARANVLPQLAGEYHCGFTSSIMRVNLAASGYIEVYEPELTTREFLDWVRVEVLPYVGSVDADEDNPADRAADDPDQPGLEEFDDDQGGEDGGE